MPPALLLVFSLTTADAGQVAKPDLQALAVEATTRQPEGSSTDAARLSESVTRVCTQGPRPRCRTFVVPSFQPVDAKGTVGDVNERIAAVCWGPEPLADVVLPMSRGEGGGLLECGYEVVVNRGRFVQVRITASHADTYDWSNVETFRFRTDDGKPWSMRDAFLAGSQKAMLGVCDAALERQRSQMRVSMGEEAWARYVEEGRAVGEEHLVEGGCLPQWLDRISPRPDGSLVLSLATVAAPHATRALGYDVVVDRAAYARWVDPKGPLGHLAAARK